MKLQLLKRKENPYNEMVPVRDIRQHLVDEYDRVRLLEIQLKNSKERIEYLEETEVKYKATLVTLEEYDSRIKRRDEDISELYDEVDKWKEKYKQAKDELNNQVILTKQKEKYIEDIERNLRKEIRDDYVKRVQGLKGHIKKEDIIKLLERAEL